jgi:hypothetical protein
MFKDAIGGSKISAKGHWFIRFKIDQCHPDDVLNGIAITCKDKTILLPVKPGQNVLKEKSFKQLQQNDKYSITNIMNCCK